MGRRQCVGCGRRDEWRRVDRQWRRRECRGSYPERRRCFGRDRVEHRPSGRLSQVASRRGPFCSVPAWARANSWWPPAASASGTSVRSGGLLVDLGGVDSGTQILSGGQEIVSSGAAIGTVVFYGGSQTVMSGGTASGTVVSDGGLAAVSSGGAASGTIVSSGGALRAGWRRGADLDDLPGGSDLRDRVRRRHQRLRRDARPDVRGRAGCHGDRHDRRQRRERLDQRRLAASVTACRAAARCWCCRAAPPSATCWSAAAPHLWRARWCRRAAWPRARSCPTPGSCGVVGSAVAIDSDPSATAAASWCCPVARRAA